MAFFTGQPAPSARPQIVVPGMMPIVVADLFQDFQILQSSLSAPNALHDLQHPAGSLAAGRALAARFVSEEATDVVQHIDDAGFLIEDRHGGRAQPQTADLAGPGEIERHIELGFRS